MSEQTALTLASANVTTDTDGVLHRVSVHVRDGRAVLKAGSRMAAPLLEREGVATVQRLNRRSYTIQFEDGTSWQVDRQGCNCGGSR